MEMDRKTLAITLGSIIAVFIFLFVVYKFVNAPQTLKEYPQVSKISADDHITWNKNAKNILVEYSDLQCPACQSFHNLIKNEIESQDSMKKVRDNIAFVYRNFPLDQHQYSHVAAYAAEAAGKQGKFFELADMLFQNQQRWENEKDPSIKFVEYAKKLNLDINQFNKDRDSKEIKDKVQRDIQSGNSFEVDATPTFYLNGKKLQLGNFSEFKDQLRTAASSK